MNKMYKNPIQNAINLENEEKLKQQMISKDQTGQAGVKITSNFKMGSIERLNGSLKDSREQFGERKALAQPDKNAKRDQYRREAHLIEELTLTDRQRAFEQERARHEPKPIHIKQSRREVVQLFKNLFVFYDKEIENQLKEGENIVGYIHTRLTTACFP